MDIVLALRMTALDAQRHAAKELAPLNITVCQYALLDAIAANPGAHTAEVARQCVVTPQSAWTGISNLWAVGLVAYENRPGLGRAKPIIITGPGTKVLNDAHKIMAVVNAHYAKTIGDAAAAIATFADTIRDQG